MICSNKGEMNPMAKDNKNNKRYTREEKESCKIKCYTCIKRKIFNSYGNIHNVRDRAVVAEKIKGKSLVLHSDNGSPI